jgi:hypothetical protein
MSGNKRRMMPLDQHGLATKEQLVLLAVLGYKKQLNTLVLSEDRYEKRPEELTEEECATLYFSMMQMEGNE